MCGEIRFKTRMSVMRGGSGVVEHCGGALCLDTVFPGIHPGWTGFTRRQVSADPDRS